MIVWDQDTDLVYITGDLVFYVKNCSLLLTAPDNVKRNLNHLMIVTSADHIFYGLALAERSSRYITAADNYLLETFRRKYEVVGNKFKDNRLYRYIK